MRENSNNEQGMNDNILREAKKYDIFCEKLNMSEQNWNVERSKCSLLLPVKECGPKQTKVMFGYDRTHR